jgi:hypothetical protein
MNTPVYRPIHETLPGFNRQHGGAAVAVILCGGAGRHWRAEMVGRDRLAPAPDPLIVLAALYLAGTGLTLAMPRLLPFRFIPHIFVLGIGAALLLGAPSRRRLALLGVVLFAEAGWVANTLIRPAPVDELTEPDQAITEFLAAAPDDARSLAPYKNLPQAAVVERGLRTADGYDPFSLVAYADLVSGRWVDYSGYAVAVPPMQASKDAETTAQIQPDQAGSCSMRYIIPNTVPASRHAGAASGRARVYERGWVGALGGARRRASPRNAWTPGEIDPPPQRWSAPLPFEAGGSRRRCVPQATNNTEDFTVRAEDAGLLVRSEAWAPGWRATVDGHAAGVLRVDCALQGIWLGAGDHTVRFDYLPQGYRAGRWISLGTAC